MYKKTVIQYSVGGYDNNFSYVVADQNTRAAAIIDPAGDIECVLEDVKQKGCTITAIWLTHTDKDHTEGIGAVLTLYPKASIYVHKNGIEIVSHYETNSISLEEGSVVQIGETIFTVMETSGHTPDSICFFRQATEQEPPLLVTGDTLFVGGCGRIDKDSAELMFSSLQKIRQFPDKTILFPGHDYGKFKTSTLGHEKNNNPYLLATTVDEFIKKRFS